MTDGLHLSRMSQQSGPRGADASETVRVLCWVPHVGWPGNKLHGIFSITMLGFKSGYHLVPWTAMFAKFSRLFSFWYGFNVPMCSLGPSLSWEVQRQHLFHFRNKLSVCGDEEKTLLYLWQGAESSCPPPKLEPNAAYKMNSPKKMQPESHCFIQSGVALSKHSLVSTLLIRKK